MNNNVNHKYIYNRYFFPLTSLQKKCLFLTIGTLSKHVTAYFPSNKLFTLSSLKHFTALTLSNPKNPLIILQH